MSNTIRRKTVKTPGWFHNTYTVQGIVELGTPVGSKRWAKEEAFWHNDKFQPWENHHKQPEHQFRKAARLELKKAMNDPEYEVQVRRGRDNGW